MGKTYSMLSEAIRRHSRGEDMVIGVVETHGRKGIAELVPQLEVVPRKKIEYKGTIFEEMDVDAILARKPAVVLVDELAHTNIPGSKHRKRYEDVLEILAAKIDVLSTVNIQHIESIAPTVHAITGVVVRETVPDWVLQLSNETVMVDLTPEALQNRMSRGDIYSTEKVDQALKNFFRRGNLIALRELALRQVAEQVDRSLSNPTWTRRIFRRTGRCANGSPSASARIRARNICSRAPRAWRAGWMRSSTPCTSMSCKGVRRTRREGTRGQSAICGEPGREDVRLKGRQRCRRSRAISCAKSK